MHDLHPVLLFLSDWFLSFLLLFFFLPQSTAITFPMAKSSRHHKHQYTFGGLQILQTHPHRLNLPSSKQFWQLQSQVHCVGFILPCQVPSPPSLNQKRALLPRIKFFQHMQPLILMTALCCNVTRYFKECITLAEATAICASPIRNASKYVFYSNINKM